MLTELEIFDASVRPIADSRGKMTVEVTIWLDGFSGVCSAPSGASTGETEVQAFPDGGALESVKVFNSQLRKKLVGMNALNQEALDAFLKEADGTGNFSRIGGNLATAISVANAKAVANYLDIPLYRYVGGSLIRNIPRPLGNVLGGGKHSNNGTTIQEFFISTQAPRIFDCIFTNIKVHQLVGRRLSEMFKDQSIGVGDERAWTCNIDDMVAVDLISDSVKQVERESKFKIRFGCDFAADSFYEKGKYVYKKEKKTRDQQIDFAVELVKKHGFTIMEDPMVDTDFEGFAEITKRVGDRCLVVGDDLYTTNPERIRKGIEMKSTNAALIKVNQIGTLTEASRAVYEANSAGWKTVISHRSGETTDDFLAHLGVAFGSELMKSGTIGGERVAKLNELMKIQEEL